MKKISMKWMLALVAVWGVCLQTFAVDFPKLPVQVPADGGKYVLVNPANLAGYMSRTTWDGAYYFLGANDSEDIPTRIQNVAPVTTTSKVYDLQGRAVSKVQKGVYIKNNKKFVK